jgi:hypothetical protein
MPAKPSKLSIVRAQFIFAAKTREMADTQPRRRAKGHWRDDTSLMSFLGHL